MCIEHGVKKTNKNHTLINKTKTTTRLDCLSDYVGVNYF